MIDHEVGTVERAAEVVRLHVDCGDALEFLEVRRRDLLDVNVEHVGHAQVLGPRHSLDGADDRRRLGAPEQVPQRQAAGQRVGVGIVVKQDQHAVGVGEVPLILQDARARHRPTQLGHQRRADQFAQADMRDVRFSRAGVLGRLLGLLAGVEDVDQRAAGVANGGDRLPDAAAVVVFDDEAGAGGDVGLEVGIDAARIADDDLDAIVVQPSCEGPAFDEEIHLEARQQHIVQGAGDQLVLTDR